VNPPANGSPAEDPPIRNFRSRALQTPVGSKRPSRGRNAKSRVKQSVAPPMGQMVPSFFPAGNRGKGSAGDKPPLRRLSKTSPIAQRLSARGYRNRRTTIRPRTQELNILHVVERSIQPADSAQNETALFTKGTGSPSCNGHVSNTALGVAPPRT
jgi:hypothetical protein